MSSRANGYIRKRERKGTVSYEVYLNFENARAQRCNDCNKRRWPDAGRLTRCPSCEGTLRDVFERRQTTKTFKRAKDAHRFLADAQARRANKTYVQPTKQTVSEFLEEWLKAIKPTLRHSTHHSYERNVRQHVMPRIGGRKLDDLRPGDLNRMYADLFASGRVDLRGEPMSPRTVRYIHTIIHRALRDAAKWGRVALNVADNADPPSMQAARDAASEMQTWTGEQLHTFLTLSEQEGDRWHAAWVVAATTGMRRGELLGLRWQDLDLEGGYASIRQTATRVGSVVAIQTATKTDGSRRKVKLAAQAVTALRAHRARQAQEKLLAGSSYQDNGLVFCREDGAIQHPETFSRTFGRRSRRYGLETIRFHDLRHTFATLALEAGVPLKVVSEMLGHSNISITANTYSHVTLPMFEDGADRVAARIFGHRVQAH